MKYPVSVLLLFATSACAFKGTDSPQSGVAAPASQDAPKPAVIGSDQAPVVVAAPTPSLTSTPIPSPSAEPSPIPTATKIEPTLEVQFIEDSKNSTQGVRIKRELVQGEDGSWIANKPIFLGIQVPQELALNFSLQGEKEGAHQSLKLFWKDTLESKTETEAEVNSATLSETLKQGIQGGALLTSFSDLFPGGSFRQAYLKLEVRGKEGAKDQVIWIRVLSPPMEFQLSQRTLPQFEHEVSPVDGALKALDSPGLSLSLLQVISATNPHSLPVIASIPAQISGKLETTFISRTVSNRFCGTTYWADRRDEQLSDGFYILPLEKDLSSRFRQVLAGAQGVGTYERALGPSETKYFGVYAAGDKAAALLGGRYPRTSLSEADAITGCQVRCGDPQNDMYTWNNDPQSHIGVEHYWASMGYPGASRTCAALDGMRIGFGTPYAHEDWLIQCAEWELQNGTTPWDDHRFCKSPAPGNPWGYPSKEFWYVHNAISRVKVGLESEPIQFSAGNSTYLLRFADAEPVGAIPIQRSVKGFSVFGMKQAD